MTNEFQVTITDIAKRAGVSKTTVSRVLNNKPDVDEATRQKILAIIQETGYTPKLAAVGLATGRTNLIGLLVPSLSRPYSLEVIRGVAEGIEENEYELVLYTTSLVEKNQERFTQALGQNLTDGLVILLPRDDGTTHLDQLRSSHFPVVLVDHKGVSSGLPTVTASNRQGAFEATKYLIGLGHRRIGFITGLLDFGASRDRLEGYQVALADAGIAFLPDLVKEGDFSEPSGYARMEGWLNSPNPPSAVFASNDEMALGVLAAIRARGWTSPSDISVIGFDDIPAVSYTTPPLTTVKQPLRTMGRKAVEMLICQIMGQTLESTEVEVPTELIVRGSCGQLNRH
jgi:LacI family transcriptional regulator